MPMVDNTSSYTLFTTHILINTGFDNATFDTHVISAGVRGSTSVWRQAQQVVTGTGYAAEDHQRRQAQRLDDHSHRGHVLPHHQKHQSQAGRTGQQFPGRNESNRDPDKIIV